VWMKVEQPILMSDNVIINKKIIITLLGLNLNSIHWFNK